MKMQRNQAKIGIGAGALLALLGLSLVAFAGDLRLSREMPRTSTVPATSPGAPSGPPTTIYLKVAGIDGESTDKEHAGWSHALSFNQDMIAPPAGPTGQPSGRRAHTDIAVTKMLDKAGPKLAQAANQNARQNKVWIEVTRSSPAGNKTFYAYELTDVVIMRYHVSGAAGAQGFPIEEISFAFDEIKVTYTEYDASGAVKGTVSYSSTRP